MPVERRCGGDEDAPNKAHDPKHIAVRVFLEHPDLFDAAADHMAMLTADRLHEYAGRERGVAIDLTAEKVEAFRTAVAALFRDAFLGDYCRVGDYDDDDEINLVVSHGSMVSTMPVVEGQVERVISVRQISHAVLRYSENTGMLRLARIRKAHQPEIAELFASIFTLSYLSFSVPSVIAGILVPIIGLKLTVTLYGAVVIAGAGTAGFLRWRRGSA